MLAEIFHLDPASGIADGNRNEIDESFREVGAAGRYVERRAAAPAEAH